MYMWEKVTFVFVFRLKIGFLKKIYFLLEFSQLTVLW